MTVTIRVPCTHAHVGTHTSRNDEMFPMWYELDIGLGQRALCVRKRRAGKVQMNAKLEDGIREAEKRYATVEEIED